MTLYSYSRINTFKNCKYQYKLQYIDKIKTEVEGIEAFMGQRIHETLEKLYSDLILSKINPLEKLIEIYNQKWEEKWHDKVLIVKAGMTAEDYRHAGEVAIKDYYSNYHPFDQAKPLWTEHRVMITLDNNDKYRLQGYIDRLDRRADGVLEIHDYKGSKNLPTQIKIDSDEQLALYQLAVQEAYPEAQGIELVWHYVLFNVELRSIRTTEQLNELESQYKSLIDEIESTTEFPLNESRLCDWCGYWENCPSKKHILKIDELPIEERKLEEGYILVDEFAQLKEREKEINADLEAVKEKLIEYAKTKDVEVIRGTKKSAKVSIQLEKFFPSKSSDEATFKELEELLHEAGVWDQVSNLNTRKLMKDLETGDLPDELIKKLASYLIEEEKERIYLRSLKEEEEDNE